MAVPTANAPRRRSGTWLALAIVGACALLWGGVQAMSYVRARRQAEVIDRIGRCGGFVCYEWEVNENLEPMGSDYAYFHRQDNEWGRFVRRLAGATEHDDVVYVEFGGVFVTDPFWLAGRVQFDSATDEDLLSVTVFPRLRRVAIRETPPQRQLTERTARELVAVHGVPSVSFAVRTPDGGRRVTLYERTSRGVTSATRHDPPSE